MALRHEGEEGAEGVGAHLLIAHPGSLPSRREVPDLSHAHSPAR